MAFIEPMHHNKPNISYLLYKLLTKNIMNSFHLLSWFQKHPRFYTFVQTCWLFVRSSGSHLATGFSSCGVVGTSTTLLKWPFIPLCTVSVPAHFELFSSGIVRWWTFQMPISSLTFAYMILCKTAFLRNTSSLGGIWFLVMQYCHDL